MNTNKSARLAGALYFIYIVVHVFANVIGRSKIIVFGDAATTAQNIMASEWQFRIGFVSDLISAVLFLLAAWALYVLLKPVDQILALLFLLLNLGGGVVECVSDLFLVASALLLSGADYLKVFQADQLQSLAMLSLYVYKNGFTIAQIFFWRMALSARLFGFQVGFPSQDFGHRVDVALRVLGDDGASALSFSRLGGNHVCQLSAWIHRGIWTDLVACNCRRQATKTSVS